MIIIMIKINHVRCVRKEKDPTNKRTGTQTEVLINDDDGFLRQSCYDDCFHTDVLQELLRKGSEYLTLTLTLALTLTLTMTFGTDV